MRNFLVFLLPLMAACSSSSLSKVPAIDPSVREVTIAPREQVEAHGKKWMVSTQGKYATQAALEVLRQGGNVIDAAITASLVIGVERPQSTGIGGGGFLIYHEAKTGHNYVVDFRERAPLRASPKMYLDSKGNGVPDLSEVGSLSIGVPGVVRGLRFLHTHWASRKWNDLVEPARKLAEKGFPVYSTLEIALQEMAPDLAKYPESKSTFLHADGTPLALGERLTQKNLARTLERLERKPDDLYRGLIARKIAASVRRHGGMLSVKDLRQYTVKERAPVETVWRGYHVVSMPPPSSGGIHVIQILKMLEHDDLAKLGFLSPQALHLEASAMQQAFADRAKYLGDPEFVKVPVHGLIADDYLQGLRAKFDAHHARKASDVFAGNPVPDDEQNTSHLTIMDEEGNTVVTTQTVNGYFGSGIVAEGTGIVLNDEMDDFAAKPGASNMFGATATTTANQVEPKKTPLSSMSPTIVFRNGKPVLALGAPGGTRIITAVAQTILNRLAFHRDLYDAIAAPRIHEQWQPDVLSIENRKLPSGLISDLMDMGWAIRRIPGQSNVMAVAREESGELIGVADPRDIGTSAGD